MTKGRLEAFSDGVIAILITIMVLELKTPVGVSLSNFIPLWPVLLSYLLSYIYLGIYWSNHHHLMQAAHRVNGAVLWANLHLLFWLSLVPFVTAWMGQNHFAPVPVAVYGAVLILAAVAYYFLAHALLAIHEKDSILARALGSDFKGKISIVIYAVAVAAAFKAPAVACGLYAAVAAVWLVPDRRIERLLTGKNI